MNRREAITRGTSPSTVIVHLVHNIERDGYLVYLCQWQLEEARAKYGVDGFRYHPGLPVPVDSEAAAFAYDSWTESMTV